MTNEITRLVPDATLVFGALCAHPADQTHARSEIHPVQLIADGSIKPIRFFDNWGKFGVSAMAIPSQRPTEAYLTTGDDLHKLDLTTQEVTTFDIPDLVDVHEITILGDLLWLSNTARNEAISFNINTHQVDERINLLALGSPVNDHEVKSNDGKVIERFHCNQIFRGAEGDTYVLVHHVSGQQFVRRSAMKVLKSQGNGGVINLTTGQRHSLNLRAPHCVRLVNDVYWVFDSGFSEIKIFDQDWQLLQGISTEGWGRGADFSLNHNRFYAGISPIRKRYLGIVKRGRVGNSAMQVFDIKQRQELGTITLDHIEQVNNIYILNEQQTTLFEQLS